MFGRPLTGPAVENAINGLLRKINGLVALQQSATQLDIPPVKIRLSQHSKNAYGYDPVELRARMRLRFTIKIVVGGPLGDLSTGMFSSEAIVYGDLRAAQGWLETYRT